jgi:ribulose-5-phosphate 4-epimerase/fuculose-1-phosphate aldolase
MARPLTRTSTEPVFDDPLELREHRKRQLVLGYRLFGALHWGALGDGHISARDPLLTDHYWLSRYGVAFNKMTIDDLVLVRPDGATVDGDQHAINPAAHCIHWPIHEARPDIVSAAHTHTPYGTPFAAQVRQVEPISQEACAFFEDHAIFDDEELDVVSVDGGKRIADALGSCKAITLRNHGHLTVGATIDEAVGWYVMFERVAETHVKAGASAKPISHEGARAVGRSVGKPIDGWHGFQWLVATYL